MHRFLTAAIVAASVTLRSQACWAADAEGVYSTQGVPSCAEFVKGEQPGNEIDSIRTHSWIAGYVSAYNAWVPATYDILGHAGMDGVALWMTNYCNAHPLDSMSRGMEVLVKEQRPKRDVKHPVR